jgi:predicted RNase H-like nuclease (RuvC/YqgF family)
MQMENQEQKDAVAAAQRAFNGILGTISNAAQFTAVGALIVTDLVLLLIVLPGQTELVNHQSERMALVLNEMSKLRLEETIERRDDKRATMDELRENRAATTRSLAATAEQNEMTRRQIDMLTKAVTDTAKAVLETQKVCSEVGKSQTALNEALRMLVKAKRDED